MNFSTTVLQLLKSRTHMLQFRIDDKIEHLDEEYIQIVLH